MSELYTCIKCWRRVRYSELTLHPINVLHAIAICRECVKQEALKHARMKQSRSIPTAG